MLELGMFMVMVLRRFDLGWAKEDAGSWLRMYWLVEPKGMQVRFRARSGIGESALRNSSLGDGQSG